MSLTLPDMSFRWLVKIRKKGTQIEERKVNFSIKNTKLFTITIDLPATRSVRRTTSINETIRPCVFISGSYFANSGLVRTKILISNEEHCSKQPLNKRILLSVGTLRLTVNANHFLNFCPPHNNHYWFAQWAMLIADRSIV